MLYCPIFNALVHFIFSSSVFFIIYKCPLLPPSFPLLKANLCPSSSIKAFPDHSCPRKSFFFFSKSWHSSYVAFSWNTIISIFLNAFHCYLTYVIIYFFVCSGFFCCCFFFATGLPNHIKNCQKIRGHGSYCLYSPQHPDLGLACEKHSLIYLPIQHLLDY